MKTYHYAALLTMLLTALVHSSLCAQLPLIQEAEGCAIVCAAGSENQANIWARGGRITPAFWGRATGDSITWKVSFKYPHTGMKLGIRYSYAHGHYSSMFPANAKRVLNLTVDGQKPIEFKVPDTGWWDLFEMVAVPLPPLKAGAHELKITPPEPDMTTNVDTLVLFEGNLTSLPASLRGTTVAVSSSKHYCLRTTPDLQLKMKPEEIFKEFERIHDHYKKYMGWAPEAMMPINVIEDDKWPSDATAFQNAGGVYFLASVMPKEQGNWVHEMTHMFYTAHFPDWFDDPSVRTLTTFVWCPTLFPNIFKPETDAIYQQTRKDGWDVIRNPEKHYDSIDPILAALCVKYGDDILSKFFHACVEAGKAGELDFRPGRWMSRDEIVKCMSKAAGEDVTPIFRQWKGFGSVQ